MDQEHGNMTFNAQVREWLEEKGLAEILATIKTLPNPDHQLKHLLALASFGAPKFSSIDFDQEKPRDIHIHVQLDEGE